MHLFLANCESPDLTQAAQTPGCRNPAGFHGTDLDQGIHICPPLGFVCLFFYMSFHCGKFLPCGNSGDAIQHAIQTNQSQQHRLFKDRPGTQFKYLFRQGQLRTECGRSNSPTEEQQKALYAITATVSAHLSVPHKVNQIP